MGKDKIPNDEEISTEELEQVSGMTDELNIDELDKISGGAKTKKTKFPY
jgi:bacteriocin-like protein